MEYTDRGLMQAIEELFQKMRQNNAAAAGTDREPGQRPSMDRRREGAHPGERFDSPYDRRPPMARERVLRLIGMDEAISQNKLAACLSIRPQSLSELLVKLEKDGYILRTKNEQDKRETLVSLTDKGKKRSREVEAARGEQLSEFLKPLTTDERELLFQLINKLLFREDSAI